jgi:Na+(H+)/acetate symporter ActP
VITTTIIAAAVSLIAGLLLGGCTNSNNELSKTLFTRNAQLENQISAGQDVVTILAITAVILAAGLAVSLYRCHGIKGGECGEEEPPNETGQ